MPQNRPPWAGWFLVVLWILGAALASTGRYTEAIEEYQTVIRHGPPDPRVRLNLALAYYKAGEISKAAAELSSLHAAEPASLVGHKSARDAVGAKLKLTTASGRTLYNHVAISVGFMSSSDKRVHFGLGPESIIRSVEIRWPSGFGRS